MTHRPRAVVVVLCSVLLWSAVSWGTGRAQSVDVIVDGLTFPAGIAFDSDGTMFVTERVGRILAYDGPGAPRAVASVPTITSGETGLLGITVSPDDQWLYAFGTESDGTNTIWRVAAEGGRPRRLITGLPGETYHNGGGVAFGHDGMLYVSNGEIHASERAQDPAALGGKVYRYTPDGQIPADNPFGDSPAFAIGLRNPFGLTIDPVSGAPFVTENGPSSFDEIDRIVAGGNYGWPVFNGPASGDTGALEGSYQDPIAAYEEIIVPTGIAFADPANARGEVSGDLFFATYGDQTIHQLVLNDERDQVTADRVYFESPEPMVALAWGPRGLYFSTPGAIKLLPLAQEDEPGGAGSPGLEETDGSPGARGEDVQPTSSTPVAVVLFGAAALVLGGSLLYAFGKRRGRT